MEGIILIIYWLNCIGDITYKLININRNKVLFFILKKFYDLLN